MKTKMLFLLTAAAAIMLLATGCGSQTMNSSSSSLPMASSSSSSSSLASPSSGSSSNSRVDYDDVMHGNSQSGSASSNSSSLPGSSSSQSASMIPNSDSAGNSSSSSSSLPSSGASDWANSASGSSGILSEPLLPQDEYASDSEMMIPESSSSIATGMAFHAGALSGTNLSVNLGSLSTRSLDWGPGGPVDALNRSQGALLYNGRYGKYNALFLGPEQKTVYMTFDEGYENGLTNTFLDILQQKQVKAMFFVTYDFVHRNPELVRRMIADGHVVGSHSWSHKNYSTLTPAEMSADLSKMHEYVRQNFNYEMKYFRFPSGNFSEQALAVVKDFGYRSIFWSFAYVDWNVNAQPQAEPSFQRVMKALCPGNIYLFHAVSSTNAQILPAVIDAVRAAGYQWGDPDMLSQVVIPSQA